MGLVVASSAAQAFDYIGLPEGIYPIVEATLYLATAPKSNSASAYFSAMKKIEEEGQVSVPRHLQDGNRDAAATGQGRDYVYPHEMEGHFTPQQYLPKRLLGTYFYAPSQEGYESQVTARLEMWREAQRKALGIERREDVPALSEEQITEMKRKIK
jgi:putative ATPase